MSLINREDLIAEYDRIRFFEPGMARKLMVDAPEVKPEPSIPISWIEGHIDWLKDMDNCFADLTAMNIETMLRKWREEQNETD